MRETPQGLPSGAHAVWEDFAQKHPDHRALRERKERDVAHQAHEYQFPADTLVKGKGRHCETNGHSRCANKKEPLSAKAIDHHHRHYRGDKAGHSDEDRLKQGAGPLRPGHPENVGRVINHRIDAGQLIKSSHHKGQQNGFAVLLDEERFAGADRLFPQRLDNFIQHAGISTSESP